MTRLTNEEDCLAELTQVIVDLRYDVPPHILPGLARYLVHGVVPGSFLTAMLTNDLRGVMQTADDENAKRLPDIWRFLYNQIPSAAWGSTENMKRWVTERSKDAS